MKRKSAVVGTVLSAMALALLATIYCVDTLMKRHEAELYQGFDCPDAITLTDATVSVTGQLTMSSDGTPLLMSSVDISLPRDWPRAAALLSDPGSYTYRDAISCLLGRNLNDIRYKEEVDLPISVSVDASRINIREVAQQNISADSAATVGLIYYSAVDDHTARLALVYPYLLTRARWSLDINAPGGSIGSTTPWPPATSTKDSAHWAPLLVPTDASCPTSPNICLMST